MYWWVLGFVLGQQATNSAEVGELAPIHVPLPPPSASPVEADSSASSKTSAISPVRQEGGQARELLSKTPGVHVAESGGMGQLQRLSVRGGASNAVAVLVDGMSWGRRGEGVDLALLPMALLESATLLRGAAAARFGPGAMAGALVFGLSKKREERLFVELLGGSFGSVRGVVGGGGEAAGGHLTAWVQAMHSDGHFAYRFDPTPNLPRDTFISLKRKNNDANKVDTLLHYALPLHTWQLEAWTHAGFQNRGLAGTVDNPSPSIRQRGENLHALLRAQGPLGSPQSPFALKLSAATHTGSLSLEGGSFGAGLKQRDNSADVSADLSWESGPHAVFAQGSFRYEKLRATSTLDKSVAERFALGAMLGGEAWLLQERWALNGLIRVDKAGHFAKPSAKLGSLWLLPGGFSLAANAGRSFRIPSFFELHIEQGQVRPNPDLKAESAWVVDAGVAWEGEQLRTSLSGFANRFENLIVWEYLPPFALKPFNLGRAQTHGVEMEAFFAPLPWLQLEMAYTWMKSQNLQRDARYKGKPLPYRPQHQLFVRAEAGPLWLSAFVEWHFQSTQTRNSYANLYWAARSLLNAGLKSQWPQNPGLQLSLSFKNLLNTHSQDMAGYPLPPLGVFCSLSLSLDKAQKGRGGEGGSAFSSSSSSSSFSSASSTSPFSQPPHLPLEQL